MKLGGIEMPRIPPEFTRMLEEMAARARAQDERAWRYGGPDSAALSKMKLEALEREAWRRAQGW